MTSSSHYPAGLENLSASSLLLENDITMKGWLMKKSGRDKIALTQRGQCKSFHQIFIYTFVVSYLFSAATDYNMRRQIIHNWTKAVGKISFPL